MNQREAFWAATELAQDLARLVDRDPEQEVQGMAVPVLGAVIAAARELLPDHPVVAAMWEPVSVEAMLDGDSVRAADALIVARQLARALDRPEFRLPEVDGDRLGEINESLRRPSQWT
jgi:hypothetical protein